jgi:hypothetical protein
MTMFPRPIGAALKGALAALALALFGASAPALAAEPSPDALALAARVLDDVGLKATVDGAVPYMLGELERNVVMTHPEMKAALHETMLAIAPDYVKSAAGVLADVAHVMASGMTEADLKQTVAFFESEAGKRYVSLQGPVLQQLNASGTAWRQQMSSVLLPRVREEMKKKGFEF